MTISFLYSGEPMTGSANDDFVIAYKGSTGTDNNTVNGNNGDDLVVGDSSDTWIPGASYLNGSIGSAFNLETLTSTWTTAENQMFGNWTIPHTTVMCEATIGQSEFFRIAIGAGQQIIIDLDFASNTAIGTTRDLVVELQDSLGNVIVTADDSLVTQGGQGSFPSAPGSASSYDPYLTFTVPTGGIYYINVRPFGSGPGSTFTENNTFVMNVSVGGHAVAASNPVQGTDTINGGEGNDALFGQGGADTINGDGGDDFIDSGSAGDIVHGGEGNDTLYGGDGTEENIHGDNGDDRLTSGGEGHYYGDAGNDIVYAGLTAGVNEILDGGADVDTIDTTTWNGGYTINLVTGATNFGEFFTNFENLVSGNGADIITGTAGANIITTNAGIDTVNAGAGNDVVAGGAEGDTLDGGADSDILNYRTSTGAVTVNLITNDVSGGHATGDEISNFEGAWGSVLGDTLTADAGNNELRGFEGNDTLSGGGGNDILDGGINDDTMTGGIGDDTYFMDSLGDTIIELAGQGTDTLAVGFSYVLANGSTLEWLATVDPTKTTAIDLRGNAGVNQITGNAGANVLDGKVGADTMIGLGGDDQYYVDNVLDVVIEAAAGGTNDRIFTTVSYTLGAGVYVEKLTTSNNAGTDPLYLTGNELANGIYGNAGTNVIDGKGGADMMVGGGGDDWYFVDNALDTVSEGSGDGTTDRISASVSYTLGAGVYVERLTTTDPAGAGAINLTGNELGNIIYGNGGANILDGGAGADALIGLAGNDWYYVNTAGDSVTEGAGEGTADRILASVSYTQAAGVYVEQLTTSNDAGMTAINLVGNEFVNQITGNAGANVLDGKVGADTMTGLGGNDFYYVDNVGDVVIEGAAEGAADRIYVSFDYTLGAGVYVEKLTTTDDAGTTAINLTGNEFANQITGNAAANILNGGGGTDALVGLGGDDIYYVDNAGDTVAESAGQGTNDRVLTTVSYVLTAGAQVERLAPTTIAGAGAMDLTGNEFGNIIYGNAGINVINGGGGADAMIGLAGNDTYYVDNAGNSVTEGASEGVNDRIFTSVGYALAAGAYIEQFATTDNAATTAINLIGNAVGQTITGNAGANAIDGRGGIDIMTGLGGDDSYYVDNTADVVVEGVGQGANDRVLTTVSYVLAAGVQVERLAAATAADTGAMDLTGNEFGNIIYGNAGANVIDGKGAADAMIGLAGNDTYYVDNAGDSITEGANEGTNDRVFASVSYTLAAGAYVEQLATTDNAATTAINFFGNALGQTITGNAGANVIDGRGGADTLAGLAGNDIYYVDNAGDVVTEAATDGLADRVSASVSYVLAAGVYVEQLTTIDAAVTTAINLTGNAFAQTITGNAGANVLDGGGAIDTMTGLGGDDTYKVDNAGDVVIEGASQGAHDVVLTTVSYTLGAAVYVEQLAPTDGAGTGAMNLTGNEFGNTIYGNAGANVLDGKGAADALVGLGGQDTFAFTTALRAGNVNSITDFSVADDTIRLENEVFTGLAAGALAAGAFNTGGAATQADDRVIYNSATGALLFDVDGLGGVAAVQFAALSTGLALTSADFFVI